MHFAEGDGPLPPPPPQARRAMRRQPPPPGHLRMPPHRSPEPSDAPPSPPRPPLLPSAQRTLPQLGPLPASQGHPLAAGEPAAAPTATGQGLGATDWEAVLLRRTTARQQQQHRQRAKGLQARLREETEALHVQLEAGRCGRPEHAAWEGACAALEAEVQRTSRKGGGAQR